MGQIQYVAFEYTEATPFAGKRYMASFPDKATFEERDARMAYEEIPTTRMLLVSTDATEVRELVAAQATA